MPTTFFRRIAGPGALLLLSLSGSALAQSGVAAGFGIGHGTAGIYADGRSDAKPGQSLIGRVGLARNSRPFLMGDVEYQLYKGPHPDLDAEFRAFSVLGGIALYPSGDFYLMPQAGWQFRSWSGDEAPVDSDDGFLASLALGYHLRFGESFALMPEVAARWGDATGAGANSYRGLGFRLVAVWGR